MKETYEQLKMEIIAFEAEDVITTLRVVLYPDDQDPTAYKVD